MRESLCLINGPNGFGLYNTKAPEIIKNNIEAPEAEK